MRSRHWHGGATLADGPDKLSSFQPLQVERHADAVMPKDFDQVIHEIAEVAGVTFSTVSRRWDELLTEMQELRYGRLCQVFDELGEAPELGDLSLWAAELESRLYRVADCLCADPGAAIPLAVLSRFDVIAGDRLALAASQLGITKQALVDQLVAPALHRSLVARNNKLRGGTKAYGQAYE